MKIRFFILVAFILTIMLFPTNAIADKTVIQNRTSLNHQTSAHYNIKVESVMNRSQVLLGMRGLAIGKINPDNVLRIVFSYVNQTTNTLHWLTLKQTAPYNFSTDQTGLITPSQFNEYEPSLCYDFNGDGLPEVFGNLDNQASFFGWNGTDYSFKWQNMASNMIAPMLQAQLYDFDHNGHPYLVSPSQTQTGIYKWNPSTNSFDTVAVLSGGAWGKVGIGDFDNDGVDEIITSVSQTSTVNIYNYTQLTSASSKTFNLEFTGHLQTLGYSTFIPFDKNANNFTEILAGTPNYVAPSYPLAVLTYNGTSLVAKNFTQLAGSIFDGVVGDINNDTLPEALFSVNGAGVTLVYKDSAGNFVVDQNVYYGSNIWIDLYDLDNDGVKEIISPAQDFIVKDISNVSDSIVTSNSSLSTNSSTNISQTTSFKLTTSLDFNSLDFISNLFIVTVVVLKKRKKKKSW